MITEMPKSETQLGAECMASVERQIEAHVPAGVRRTIICPFCGHLNIRAPGTLLCCDDLRKAMIAVLMGKRALKIAEAASSGD